MHAEILGKTGRFLWNVDGTVGLNSANIEDDVMFVQWCLYKMSKFDALPMDLRTVLAKTPVSGRCTGREGDQLITSIRAVEKIPFIGATDGKVSPVKGDQFYGRGHTYVIVYFNNILRSMYPQQYPRIDLMPEFIWRIKDKAFAPFLGI